MKRNILTIFVIFSILNLFSQDLEKANLSLEKRGEVVFSFSQKDANNKLILNKLSIDKITEEGRIFAYTNKESFAWFLEQNIPWQYELHTSEMPGEWTMWNLF